MNSFIYYFHRSQLLPWNWEDRRRSVGTANVEDNWMWHFVKTDVESCHHHTSATYHVAKCNYKEIITVSTLELTIWNDELVQHLQMNSAAAARVLTAPLSPHTALSPFLKNEIVILIRPLSMLLCAQQQSTVIPFHLITPVNIVHFPILIRHRQGVNESSLQCQLST